MSIINHSGIIQILWELHQMEDEYNANLLFARHFDVFLLNADNV